MPLTINIQSPSAASISVGSESVSFPSIAGTITPLTFGATLASGNNSFTVPAGSLGVIITPPPANAIVLKYKTTSGDTGVNIPLAIPSIFLFDVSNMPATCFINAASLTTGTTQLLFF